MGYNIFIASYLALRLHNYTMINKDIMTRNKPIVAIELCYNKLSCLLVIISNVTRRKINTKQLSIT